MALPARTAWVGTINSTAIKYLKGAADNTIRNRMILAFLRKKGRIKLNQSGDQCVWDVEHKQPPTNAYGDGDNIAFERRDLLKQMAIDWRGYTTTDLMTDKEKEENKGDVAIVNRYNRIMSSLMKGLRDNFAGELFVDGHAAGNENRLHGLETFAGNTTTVAADISADPSDTYAGLSTALNAMGGTWTSDLSTSPNANAAVDWPYGTGDTEYDYLSPKLPNWSSTSWPGGATTWLDNCQHVLRTTTTWLKHTCGPDGKPTMYLMEASMLDDYKNRVEARQRIIIPHKGAQDLGFDDVMNQDGVAIDDDYDCPVNTFYGINVDKMELASLKSSLWFSHGPEWSIDDLAWKFIAGFFGNCRYNPKYFAKGKNYA